MRGHGVGPLLSWSACARADPGALRPDKLSTDERIELFFPSVRGCPARHQKR